MCKATRLRLRSCALAAALLLAGRAHAQVVRDGSVGRSGTVAKVNNNFNIPVSDGTLRGQNLFHSFSRFDLASGESAVFTGPATIHNIFGRVTGGQSNIDGTIACRIPGATFYLMNPDGVVFGPNAKLDTRGSFVVTTADEIHLGSSGRFPASINAPATLISAAPRAFGFLSARPAAVVITGIARQSRLAVPAGNSLSIVAGDVHVTSNQLRAPGGAVTITSAANAGLATFDPAQPSAAALASGQAGGAVTLTQFAALVTDGPSAGHIDIRAGSLSLTNTSALAALNRGPNLGAGVQVHLSGTLTLTQSSITADTFSRGTGGSIAIKAGDVVLDGQGTLNGIFADTAATGSAGSIRIDAHALTFRGGAQITSVTTGRGRGGSININSAVLNVDGTVEGTFDSSILANTQATGLGGDAGNITIHSADIRLTNGGQINSASFGLGRGGSVNISTNALVADGENTNHKNSGIAASSQSGGAGGDAGGVNIHANRLRLTGGADIITLSKGTGAAGTIAIDTSTLTIDGESSTAAPSGISANSQSAGAGGNAGGILIAADTIQLTRGGQITSITSGLGNGGLLQIDTRRLLADGETSIHSPSGVVANSQSFVAGGNAGDVHIQGGEITLTHGAEISSTTFGQGQGGSVNIDVNTILAVGENTVHVDSGIFANSAASGKGGAAGDIQVRANGIHLAGGAEISSTTFGQGHGGSVRIKADKLLVEGEDSTRHISAIFANSQSTGDGGNAGDLRIEGGEVDLTGAGMGSFSFGRGRGGSIHMDVNALSLRHAALISVEATQSDGGDIAINATGPVTLNASDIAAKAFHNGGSVRIASGKRLEVRGSNIRAEAGSNGTGGDIFLGNSNVILADATGNAPSSLVASALRGNGGQILILANQLTRTGNTVINFSSQFGAPGAESIISPNVLGGLIHLNGALASGAITLQTQCALRLGVDASSFLTTGRAGTSVEPGGFIPSLDLRSNP